LRARGARFAGVLVAAVVQAAALALPAARVAAQDAHALIVVGIGGDTIRSKRFQEWASGLYDALIEKHGMNKERVIYLGERPEADPTRIKGPSRKENVQAAIKDLAARAGAQDPVLLVLIGGSTSANNAETSLNLTGPDLTGAELATALQAFTTQPLAVVSTTESSGPLVQLLSGPNRTIITATRTGAERNQTWFGQYFVAAYTGDDADADKDNRISLVEAYNYATREVARHYQEQGLLMTEHALIDDNGDAKGSPAPDAATGDGQLASTFAVGRVASAANANTDDPVLRGLLQQRAEIEGRLNALRARRTQMEPAQYDMELEALLVELALKDQEIRRRGGGA
jgi:hypothetical protein